MLRDDEEGRHTRRGCGRRRQAQGSMSDGEAVT